MSDPRAKSAAIANAAPQRKRSSQDERRVDIRLTPAGRKLKAGAARVSACVIRASACPVPELLGLTRQVQALGTQLTA